MNLSEKHTSLATITYPLWISWKLYVKLHVLPIKLQILLIFTCVSQFKSGMMVNQVGRESPLNWKATSLKRECLVVKVLRTTLITKYITSSQFQLYCRNLLTLSECLRLVLKFFFTYATATVELKLSEFPFNKVYLYTISFFHFAPETFIFLSYTL